MVSLLNAILICVVSLFGPDEFVTVVGSVDYMGWYEPSHAS